MPRDIEENIKEGLNAVYIELNAVFNEVISIGLMRFNYTYT